MLLCSKIGLVLQTQGEGFAPPSSSPESDHNLILSWQIQPTVNKYKSNAILTDDNDIRSEVCSSVCAILMPCWEAVCSISFLIPPDQSFIA